MEEEKSQPPDLQLEPTEQAEATVTPGAAAAAADAPVYDNCMDEQEEAEADQQVIDAAIAAPVHDVDMKEEADVTAEEEADRQNRAAALAADEEMAHRLYMQDLMEMEEWQLRDFSRPSLRAALDFPLSDFPSSSRAAVGFPACSCASGAGVGANTTAPGKFWAGTPPYALNPKDPVVQPQQDARATGTFESVQEAESGAVFLGNARIPGPLEALADNRIREIRATAPSASNGGLASSLERHEADPMSPGPRDFATTPARQTVLSKDAAGSSSTQHVPGDGKASADPSQTPAPASVVPSARCCATARPARPTAPANNGPVCTKRRALLADADSAFIFAGMEEGHNNSWYESIVVPDGDEEPEQVEMQGLNESLQQCLPRFEPCNPAATVAQGPGFSLQNFCQRWGVTPSDVEPDEPGPSTRAPRVPPLADHEVPAFDCGICMDTLPVFNLFHGLPCKHKFCASCMTTYVEGRIRSSELPIPCPDLTCGRGDDDDGGGRGVLHPEKCKKAIDYGAFVDWGARLTESAIAPGRRAYCPNRRCGIPLETSGEVVPARALCLACGYALCATCGMEWSSDDGAGLGAHDCAKGPDAMLVRKLAHDSRWKRCPSCKMYVERIDGCNRMTCRCRFVFCYRCGRPSYRGQVGGAGLEPCRCNNAGLAFAMGHLHQAHPNIVDQAMQLPPVEPLELVVDLNVPPQQPPPEPEVVLNQQALWDDDDIVEYDWD
ncbi:hypothetical protein ACQ4PT_014088 [Festuca glaucescens]